MKISVIIPLYNKEKYIKRTIKSALYQETPADEILVIDDGSTDSSASEVRSIHNPLVRLIQQTNAGEGAARNRGAKESNNDIIAFLDADDEWKPGFLTNITRLVYNFPRCGAYATAYETVYDNGLHKLLNIHEIPPEPWIGILPNLIKILNKYPFFPSSIAFNKQAYLDLGGFPEGVRRGADTMLWIKLGIRYPIAYSSSHQVIYHTDAIGRVCQIYTDDSTVMINKLMIDLLQENSVPHSIKKDFKNFYAYLNLQKAKELIKNGESKKAREFLNNIKRVRLHPTKRKFWCLVSYFPSILLNLFHRLKKLPFKETNN